MKKHFEMQKASVSKAESVLNDEQKKMLKELLGEPVEIKYRRSSE